jgi:predicted phage terminase large subunit-like protein
MTRSQRLKKPLDARGIDLLIEAGGAKARERFADFRRFMHPEMHWGWWPQEVSERLQQFYNDLVSGRRPKMALMAPPQIGKSSAATDFIAWTAGKNPDLKTIFASYSDELGIRTNVAIQRIIKDPRYATAFARTQIGVSGWQCNNNLIEYAHRAGGFRNTTVLGAVTGLQLDLGVIDDPVKGRHEVSSRAIRNRTWDWFTDDFLSRFAADAGLLVIMTRWHIDDLLGRALEKFADFQVLRYPAIAEDDEPHRKKGEALFPQFKPLEFLLSQKSVLTQASWESLYQQHPIIVGGGELPIEKLKVLPHLDRSQILGSVRYRDKGGSDDEDAAFTAGCLMHRLLDKTYVIEHIARGRWSALDRERWIKACADADSKACISYEVWVEQEPGTGGKESAENTIRNLAGKRVHADKVTGSKRVRAEPFAAQVQAGNVFLLAGGWVSAFRDECEAWPNSKYKDQVDAAAGAFNRLASGRMYNTNYAQWVD